MENVNQCNRMLKFNIMVVLYEFRGHLTLDVRSATHAMNTDPAVIPGQMTM
jgi:hypothetical protein